MDNIPAKFNWERAIKPDVKYSAFNMSYDKKLTCNSGELIPVYEQEVYPGDMMLYKNAFLIKSLPLVTPIMSDYYIYVHYWFTPYSLIQSHETIEKGLDVNTFEDYINATHESDTVPLIWEIDEDNEEWTYMLDTEETSETTTGNFAYVKVPVSGSHFGLLDYLCQNPRAKNSNTTFTKGTGTTVGANFITQFAVRAYNATYNTKYRNEDVQDSSYEGVGGSTFARTDGVTVGISLLNSNILRRNWERDYFTSELPWQQKGTPIALPVTSSISVNIPTYWTSINGGTINTAQNNSTSATVTGAGDLPIFDSIDNAASYDENKTTWITAAAKGIPVTSTAFDINDLRETNAIQRFLEANARGGTKYHEFCKAHFGVAPADETIREPRYLGGSKTPLIISEVTQTSSSTLSSSTPQGTITGKAAAADSQYIFQDRFKEHGIVMGIMSIMPKPVYANGINRMWYKSDFFDWYSPEFANLGEQAVIVQEANAATPTPRSNETIMGYVGRWSEMRARDNCVTSGFRISTASSGGYYGGMADWTIQKDGFTLNSANLVCHPDEPFWAFPKANGNKNFICDFGNIVKMIRPLPYEPEPMLRA